VLSTDLASDAESEDLDICVGALIRLGSPPHLNTYIVESIECDGTVCCKDPADEHEAPVFITMVEAKRRYNEYIRY
jgi:hypothetical protein